MLNTSAQQIIAHEEIPIAYKSKEGIPLIPIDAMAGALTENSQAVMEYECEHYVIPMFKGAEFLIPVKVIRCNRSITAGISWHVNDCLLTLSFNGTVLM